MHTAEPLESTTTISNSSEATPSSPQNSSLHPLQLQQQQQQQQQQERPSLPYITASDNSSQQHSPQSLLPSLTPILNEFAPGEDVSASTNKNVTLSSRTGSTGSQLVSPVNEIRKRTSRRVLPRPRPLDLDSSKLNSGSGSEPRIASAFPALGSGSGTGITIDAPSPREPKHRAKFPSLYIKTDLNPQISFRRSSTGPASASIQNNSTHNAHSISNTNEVQRREPSKHQVGLERILKKIQRRKHAPSNLAWYATHSMESYLAETTLDEGHATMKQQLDTETEGLYFGEDKPPSWIAKSMQEDEPFFSDDTVDLMLGLRDYLIKAKEAGWDVTELKEEIFPITHKAAHHSRRNRSVSPHGSPLRSPNIYSAVPASPGGASQDSPNSSRHGSRSSIDLDYISQRPTVRYTEEEAGSYRLLDYFLAVLSDIISHDCRYKIQNPRPFRPEWILHSIVLDVLTYLSKELIRDHKAIYDIGMISLSAFPVFKNNSLVRLLDLLTGTILPSFAHSRTKSHTSTSVSPPLTPTNPASPLSPSEIRVQLDNNQTFAIQVHSPTEEQGMLSVPQQGVSTLNPLNSPHIFSSRSNITSASRATLGPTAQAQDILDIHANSLIALTLLAMLQQISFSKSPLPVAKQLQTSVGDLLRAKPNISTDLLELIAIVEDEKVMRRALEVLWWIEKPSLGHLILSDKFSPLDYDSILQMRHVRKNWNLPGYTTIAARSSTVMSDTLRSFRKGAFDDEAVPRSDLASRVNSFGSFGSRSKRSYRPTLPWRTASGTDSTPMATLRQQDTNSMAAPITDYLADHELYPYMFSTAETEDHDAIMMVHCELCEVAMTGFGLHCYHCRGALHLECFYSVKRYAGVDCMQLGCALDIISCRSRSQLVNPAGINDNGESTDQRYHLRSGHRLQPVNMFSTCLCSACKLPLWGYHNQGYWCEGCSQLMHLECQGSPHDCETAAQPLALRHSFHTRISYKDLRQSFLDFYRELVSTWESFQTTPSLSATLSPATKSFPQHKERYSYEEASCNASALALQLELLKVGISRGEVQVQEWIQDGQATDQTLMESSEFELFTLQKYFADLVHQSQDLEQAAPRSMFLSDFFEDSKPDMFLLFSLPFWSHFAALAKTIIRESETAAEAVLSNRFFPTPTYGGSNGDDTFEIMDATQELLIAEQSVRSHHVPLATIYQFLVRRLGFHSSWTAQMVLQEWVKIGLLERLDGKLSLFENATRESNLSPPSISVSPSPSTNSRPTLDLPMDRVTPTTPTMPTIRTSYFDFAGRINDFSSLKDVHCLFPIITAIDPSSDVENLIHAVWRCLSSVDLSVNECGFLLLTRQCWPDPFMSDNTAERLVGCVFHWFLMEDEHLIMIHKKYASKGKAIPGVRDDLEEQVSRKRVTLKGGNIPLVAGRAESSISATATSAQRAGVINSPIIANGTNTSANSNSRSNSANSNLFGTVGSYVMTRKLMVKKFALPWLKKVMDLDPRLYSEMSYRQIRVLEREMAPGGEGGRFEQEGQQTFRQRQSERYLESIAKLRNAGFLFNKFSSVLCHWLEDVEGLLNGMDVTSKNFKILNRLFAKASGRNGSGLGLSTSNGGHASLDGHPRQFSDQQTITGSQGGTTEWRRRLRAKLHRGVADGSPNSLSEGSTLSGPENHTQQPDDAGETPLNSLRMMLKPPQDQISIEGANIQKALSWLDIMVHSGVQVPSQAFFECCEGLLDMNDAPLFLPVSQETARPTQTEAKSSSAPSSETSENGTVPPWAGSNLLEMSRDFLKSCWGHIALSAVRMSEEDVGEIVETVLAVNESKILKVMNSEPQSYSAKELESVRQLLKYALVLVLYVYGCPIYIILSLEIAPLSSDAQGDHSQQEGRSSDNGSYLHLQQLQQLHQRQQRLSSAQVDIDRDTVSTSILLKCLSSHSLSLQGEVVEGLAVMLEHSGRVSNIDEFMDSIHMEVIPCLWDLLSPLYDHMADTTIPLLMRFISQRPSFFHKVVSRQFNEQEWEVRFAALDPVFGLFSKLDDALVLKVFSQQAVPNSSPAGTMLSNKGKNVEKPRRQRGRQHTQKKKMGTSSFEPESNGSGGTGLSGQEQNQYHQTILQALFMPEHLQILGPVFSFFVSSMWDKEEAVRTKAKTLLKSLQPVHVVHALKSWELHFISSTPETQQTLLKLMTRLNNYFPSWRIMNYDLVFHLLTNGELGRPLDIHSDSPSGSSVGEHSPTPSVHGSGDGQHPGTVATNNGSREIESDHSMRAQGPVRVSLPYLKAPGENLSQAVLAAIDEEHSERGDESEAPLEASSILDTPSVIASMPAGESSRSQKRASILSGISAAASAGPLQEQDEERMAHEKQLELEDDISCSLLNLALQMVANGIEPRLKEVIQLKYLVVFYLDFEGCELLDLGHGKYQVRYGEYIPRQRTSLIYGEENDGLGDADVLRNDPGHESFVLTICQNLQLILDRYVEIKPDHEIEAPTLYDRIVSGDSNRHGGLYGFDGASVQSDPQVQSPSASRTFSATTAMSIDLAKISTRIATPKPQDSDDDDFDVNSGDSGDEDYQVHQNFFCFPRRKRKQDLNLDNSFNQQSTASQKNQFQQSHSLYGQHAAPRYQQQHHHHYRRNQYRRQDENAPVVGTYFVDVILRFFGSETDLSILPVGRLKNWLELLFVVIYKYVHEVDPLSDLVVVLMKRIIEMLMTKRGTSSTSASSNTGSTSHQMNSGAGRSAGATPASIASEESMSEENILLAISICSTLLKRSSTMTTAILSREIMAMSRLMTRRREDPEDPVLIRAKNFLHDAFVHFLGNGLFLLIFKAQPSQKPQLFGSEGEAGEVGQDLDLFYVLATVLGEEEMVPQDSTSNPSSANTRLVHFRDQPIRDILDRVTIFRDLDPVQVSAILTNLSLYVERVHSKCEDSQMMVDMGQFLIKITKYTADWEQQQQHKLKELAQQQRQEQAAHNQTMQHQHPMKQQSKTRHPHYMFAGNTSAMASNVSSPQFQQHQQEQQEQRQHGQGAMSVNSASTTTEAAEQSSTTTALQTPQAMDPISPGLPPASTVGVQRNNTMTSTTLTPTATSTSSLPSSPIPQSQQQDIFQTRQSMMLSSATSDQPPPSHPATPLPATLTAGRKILPTDRRAALLMDVVPLDLSASPTIKSRIQHSSTFNSTHSSSSRTPQHSLSKFPAMKKIQFQTWDYSNAVLNMCSILMVQNPLEGHHLITAVKHVLKQALYRDRITAVVMIRLVTAYCFIAELDFSLSLVNVFGEFVVEELRTSIANNLHGRYEDDVRGEDEVEDIIQDGPRSHVHGRPQRSGSNVAKERESTIGVGSGVGSVNLGLGSVGLNVGAGNANSSSNNNNNNNHSSNRSRILASNFHLLHHLLIWDLDPSYNMEWTQIKWGILGSMRFPPGHPILFPGANDDLRKETAAIVSVWADKYPS
ncbi:hypothetical protein BGX26_011626 [Mortierella sp. AD094]|nr:hypothetical protein BGX26_011626 [Mortierella sp. AD094]